MIDVNDESPEFQFMVYKGQIEENLPQGSPVLEVKAIDGDDQNMVSCSWLAVSDLNEVNLTSK